MSTVGLTVNVIIANKHYYWDRHVWDVPITAFTGVLKVAFSAKLIFVYASTFTRQSLLCFYYRLVADSGIKWFGWALHATVFLNVAAVITFTCLGIWQCNPISAYWTLSPPAGAYCLDEGKTVLGIGIVNCFIDLLVTVLPIPLVRKLQMPLQQRIGIIILLSMGLLVVVAGVVRTYYIWKGLIASYDETWYTFPLWIAAAVEINLGVVNIIPFHNTMGTAKLTTSRNQICACMPALRPFIKRCVAPAFSSVSSRISSLISGSSTTPENSTVQNSRHSRGHGSYQKFRNNRKTNDPTSNSSADSSTLKEMGRAKHPHITHHHHTTSIDADADDHHNHDHDHDNHDDDEVSFLPHPHARDIAYNVTPRLPPPPPPRSPLQITYRQSFELVSLDRRQERRDDFNSPPRSPRRQRQGRHEQEQEQQLDLDPRGRLEGSAAFGCQTRVSSRHGLCDCKRNWPDPHLTIELDHIPVQRGEATAISYVWGEFDRRDVPIGHPPGKSEDIIRMNLGIEWVTQDVIHRLAEIAADKPIWMDQLCIPQNDEEIRRILANIATIYKTFDVAVLMPGHPCACLSLIVKELEARAAEEGKGRIPNLDDDIESYTPNFCLNVCPLSSWMSRLWTFQELGFSQSARCGLLTI
ncbi:hypothetical protein BFW01_g5600 [Lasiodiplodia theobromae]|nr:hypothetical protein BFW01_g5600 [Lasiodiplodia theobromae]